MTAIPPFTFHQGTQPLLVSIPHCGTHVPPEFDTNRCKLLICLKWPP